MIDSIRPPKYNYLILLSENYDVLFASGLIKLNFRFSSLLTLS